MSLQNQLLTKDEFIDSLCAARREQRERFLKEVDIYPCDCGHGACRGWRIVGKNQRHTNQVGPDPIDHLE